MSEEIKEEHQYLAKFYDVDNYADMVEIMAEQIKKLQKRLPPLKDEQAKRIREG